MRTLVLGANGQDGSYLCEELLAGGDEVFGLGLEESALVGAHPRFHYLQCDLRDSSELVCRLADAGADEIYHLAAIHGSSGFNYEPVWASALDVNVKSLHTILEHARLHRQDLRVFYASSAKVFGPLAGAVKPTDAKLGDCLYSLTKIAAEGLLRHYRRVHGIDARIGYMFNHESPRRGPSFFISKVTSLLASILRSDSRRESVYTLDFFCDWGCAREYMQMVRKYLRANDGGATALVFATGHTWHAREMVRQLFASYDLDFSAHLDETHPSQGPVPFAVDISETVRVIGHKPSRGILDVARECVENSLHNQG